MARIRLAVVWLAGGISAAATVALTVGQLDAEGASRAWVACLVAALLAADVKLSGGGGPTASVLLAAASRAALLAGASEAAGLIVGAIHQGAP